MHMKLLSAQIRNYISDNTLYYKIKENLPSDASASVTKYISFDDAGPRINPANST